MALPYQLPPIVPLKQPSKWKLKSSNTDNNQSPPSELPSQQQKKRRCLRCGTLYNDKDNSPTSCLFHGHTTGERGLFALAPPHQGVDGEWTDGSGVIVYRWNEKGDRPNTGRVNWKRRWSCCSQSFAKCRYSRKSTFIE
ncbi:hypothetical protein QJS10_CPB22g01397 [Acorus calamus]|uniref:Uncharacterized protein n=1 Tax=Acorus calamus TaxID=4465 RepID=A0AAV9C1L9_ACOCL|nr:hypothetical protein QJS10_CPB22g01397 [Acorus calamus]